MTTAIEISELGMINAMRQLDVVSNNLANASTTGFKRDLAVTRSFEQFLSQLENTTERQSGFSNQQLVPEMTLQVDHSPGALQRTNNPLDFAIEGNGYFELLGKEGARYTRTGAFSVAVDGRLVNSQGLFANGVEGEILLQGGEVTVDRDGTVRENGEYAGQLKLVTFANPELLTKVGHGLWENGGGQAANPATSGGVRQAYREASNVKPMEEMVNMMTTMRQFESMSHVVKGYDEMMNTAISTIAEF